MRKALVFLLMVSILLSFSGLSWATGSSGATVNDIKISAKATKSKIKENSTYGIDLVNSEILIELKEKSKTYKDGETKYNYDGVITFSDRKRNLKFDVKGVELLEYVVNGKAIKHGAIDLWVDDDPITISLYLSGQNIFAFTVFGDISKDDEVEYGNYFEDIAKFEQVRNATSPNEQMQSFSGDVGIMATSDVEYRGTVSIYNGSYKVGSLGLYVPYSIKDQGGAVRPIGGRMWSNVSGMNSWYLSQYPSDIIQSNKVDDAIATIDVSQSPYFQLFNEFDPAPSETSVTVPVVFVYSGSLYNYNITFVTSRTSVSNSKIGSGLYYNLTTWDMYKSGGFSNSDTEMETSNGAYSSEGFAFQNNFAFQGQVAANENYNVYSKGKMRYAMFVLINGNPNNSYTKYYWM